MEQSILEAEREMESIRTMQSGLTASYNVLQDQDTIRSQLSQTVVLAERNFDKLRSIEGIGNWRVRELEESIISIDFKDRNIAELGVSVTFKELPDDKSNMMICQTQVRKESSSKSKRFNVRENNYSNNVMAYMEYGMQTISKEVNSWILHSSSDMYNVINQMEWNLGRLALIGKEFSFLERRHGASLQCNDNNSTSFTLEVKIDTKRGHVGAHFYICEAYPFAVLDVELMVFGDSDIDIDSLERQLTKASRPGFGYLTRACNVIACFEG